MAELTLLDLAYSSAPFNFQTTTLSGLGTAEGGC